MTFHVTPPGRERRQDIADLDFLQERLKQHEGNLLQRQEETAAELERLMRASEALSVTCPHGPPRERRSSARSEAARGPSDPSARPPATTARVRGMRGGGSWLGVREGPPGHDVEDWLPRTL